MKTITHLKTPMDDFNPYIVLIPYKESKKGFELTNYFGLDSQFNHLSDTFLEKEQVDLIDKFGKTLYKLDKKHLKKKYKGLLFKKINPQRENDFQLDVYKKMCELDDEFKSDNVFYTFRWIIVQRIVKNKIHEDKYFGIGLGAQGKEKLCSLNNDFLKTSYTGFRVF